MSVMRHSWALGRGVETLISELKPLRRVVLALHPEHKPEVRNVVQTVLEINTGGERWVLNSPLNRH